MENNNLARVTKISQNIFTIRDEQASKQAIISGKLLKSEMYPAIGDYVHYRVTEDQSLNMIDEILERRSSLSRKVAGSKSDEQVIASNIDYVFIVMSLNDDFNMRRLERYLIAAWESGASPLIILTKQDVCDDLDDKLDMISHVAFDTQVVPVSAVTGYNMDLVEAFVQPNVTVALVGSSGVGKSTLINTLAGKEVMDTAGIRQDDSRGRHTTTHREMIVFDNGFSIIDTPGMREFSVYDGTVGIDLEFSDILAYSQACKFSDCQHQSEPGCHVKEKLASGELEVKRYESYLKLKKEIRFQEKKRQIQEKKLAKKSKKRRY